MEIVNNAYSRNRFSESPMRSTEFFNMLGCSVSFSLLNCISKILLGFRDFCHNGMFLEELQFSNKLINLHVPEP